MRSLIALGLLTCVLCGLPTAVTAQDVKAPVKRFGVEADAENYPQSTAKEAFATALKLIDQKRFDYLIAHLSDPEFVETRVKNSARGGQAGFDDFVKEVTAKLTEDQAAVAELRRFFRVGTWEENDTTAVVKLDDLKGKGVFLKKVENRWVLENKKKLDKK